MTRFGSAHIGAVALASVLFAPSHASAQGTEDPIATIVGQWDQVDSTTSIEIRPDHTVQHSEFGVGDIKHDNADYFAIYYRHRNFECQYQIKRYSATELKVVRAQKTDSLDCELGMLRLAPGSSPEPDPPPTMGPPGGTAKPENGSKTGDQPPSGARLAGPMPLTQDVESRLLPTQVFKECEACPDMVVVPAGDFNMGSPETEAGRDGNEGPVRRVTFARPFAVGRFAITRDEFMAFVGATRYQYGEGCHAEVGNAWVELAAKSFLSPPGFAQEGRHPAVCISWKDANEYVKWLSAQTQKNYRLLTESEREYITRAGTSTPYWWGEAPMPDHANYDKRMRPAAPGQPLGGQRPNKVNQISKPMSSASSPGPNPREASFQTAAATAQPGIPSGTPGQTVPVDQYMPNAWGIYQVHGNVAEWVQDCWNSTYLGAPTDGSAAEVGDCARHVLRGGGWNGWPEDIRAAFRGVALSDNRYYQVGFRVARSLGN